jgi:hypothetical protein
MRHFALLALYVTPAIARADGEHGPMVGGALIATRAPDTELAGAQLELGFWGGRLGLAAESSYQAGFDTRVATLGGSARLLLYREMTPSLIDPADTVELGIELHAIAERAWWDDDARAGEPTSYGGAVVIRLRGDTDFSNVLAESRLFVRALWSRPEAMDSIARTTLPPAERGAYITIGIGASFGSGAPGYVRQFRSRPLDARIPSVN